MRQVVATIDGRPRQAGDRYTLKGKKLGRFVHGQPQTTNLAFGGADCTPVPALKKG